ncbi:hypothetical protein SELMODRAFT_407178 [Selaginella moellendorffii]|uniref:non-specific serine/threonine protein kinase n=1 Tax=Selaginella moellendorffii TaxID=88036 RepID=D8R456_SELML|nr:hypothetical protein SELMODRAFT_407178 [Selaginella moellendorffii]
MIYLANGTVRLDFFPGDNGRFYLGISFTSCPTGSRPANEDWAQGCTTYSKISRIAVGVGAGAALLLLLGLIIGIMKILKTKTVPSSGKSPCSHGWFQAAVFKGCYIQGEAVAVERLIKFEPELSTIGTLQHVNLVRLRGYCGKERLLVYEFVEGGSQDRSLFNRDLNGAENSVVLSWSQRFGIALGTAKGLPYLHEECRDRIIHYAIKPENILLDAKMKPKVADFGLGNESLAEL